MNSSVFALPHFCWCAYEKSENEGPARFPGFHPEKVFEVSVEANCQRRSWFIGTLGKGEGEINLCILQTAKPLLCDCTKKPDNERAIVSLGRKKHLRSSTMKGIIDWTFNLQVSLSQRKTVGTFQKTRKAGKEFGTRGARVWFAFREVLCSALGARKIQAKGAIFHDLLWLGVFNTLLSGARVLNVVWY